jgi:glycosyltransferase involved in cell wall biosynthesis
MADGPLVSVVIPCFNGEKYLAEAIRSALCQTYRPLEVIVVDDGSTDGSRRIIDEFASQITTVRQANSGLPAARNAGISASKGALLAFLDCDDYWDPEFLASMVGGLEGSGAAIAYCGWQNIGLPGPRGQPFIPPDYETDESKLLLLVSGVRWPVHAALVRRQVMVEAGGFDQRFSSCEDFALWIRTATRHKLVRVPKVLAFYRHHGGAQMTKKRAQIALNHWLVQHEYFRDNPSLKQVLGQQTLRRISDGQLLAAGYRCFWDRDLDAARAIFRRVMRNGYGTVRDWKYMLPALLPVSLYKGAIGLLDAYRRRDQAAC